MKKLLAFVLALSLLCMGGVALADGETLVIYSARNERLNNIVIPAFEAKTGIKVEMITGSSGEVLQRVKSEVETGNVTVDIHWAADETMLSANRDLFDDAPVQERRHQLLQPRLRRAQRHDCQYQAAGRNGH